MDENEAKAREMLRSAMGKIIKSSLEGTAAKLQTAAEHLQALSADVDRIGLLPKLKGQRPIAAEDILAEALMVLHTQAPDLGNLARAVAEYNREVRPPSVTPEGDDRCMVIYAGTRCTTESLPGVTVCFPHLWQTAQGHGVGNVFPLGSPEPSEARVPRGVPLVGENGVHWMRNGDRWIAGGPVGDGGLYSWRAVNGAGNDTGRELARLFPVVER